MSAYTFFGHRNCPDVIKQHLREVLLELVTTKAVDMFMVVAYVTHSWGGAYRYVEKAKRAGKTVINLG